MQSLGWILVMFAGLTLTLAIFIMISYMARTRANRYTDTCDCGCEQGGLDICSSECDQKCADNNHYEGQEWRCHY